ncbi:MAG: hypothetical protein IIA27_04210 [Gemmatimonadetes bacterium]|nr:hypothetical protein [Gemmatimonadota bacterium]
MDLEGALAIFFIFGGGAAFLMAMSPIGRAVADRIRGRGVAGSGGGGEDRIRFLQESQDSMLEELDSMRHEIGDLQERVDFTERLIAQKRDQDQLQGRSDVQG